MDERVYDKFLQALKERVEKITVGDPTQNVNMGPVINEKSMKNDARATSKRASPRADD